MLVLRVSAFGLVRAASHPAWCGTPVFALFADAHLPALLGALAAAAPGQDTWLGNLEMAPVSNHGVCGSVRGRVDVCLRKCDAGEVALAIIPVAAAPVLPRMTLPTPRKVSLGSAIAAIKAEAAAAPLSPAASIVSVSDCGMISDRDEDEDVWEEEEEEDEDEVHAPVHVLRAPATPSIDAIGCSFVVPSRKLSATMPTLPFIKVSAPAVAKKVNPPVALRHRPEPARRPAAPSPDEKELEEIVAAMGRAALKRTVSVV